METARVQRLERPNTCRFSKFASHPPVRNSSRFSCAVATQQLAQRMRTTPPRITETSNRLLLLRRNNIRLIYFVKLFCRNYPSESLESHKSGLSNKSIHLGSWLISHDEIDRTRSQAQSGQQKPTDHVGAGRPVSMPEVGSAFDWRPLQAPVLSSRR